MQLDDPYADLNQYISTEVKLGAEDQNPLSVCRILSVFFHLGPGCSVAESNGPKLSEKLAELYFILNLMGNQNADKRDIILRDTDRVESQGFGGYDRHVVIGHVKYGLSALRKAADLYRAMDIDVGAFGEPRAEFAQTADYILSMVAEFKARLRPIVPEINREFIARG